MSPSGIVPMLLGNAGDMAEGISVCRSAEHGSIDVDQVEALTVESVEYAFVCLHGRRVITAQVGAMGAKLFDFGRPLQIRGTAQKISIYERAAGQVVAGQGHEFCKQNRDQMVVFKRDGF